MLSALGGNTVRVFDATSFCLESGRSKICLKKNRLARTGLFSNSSQGEYFCVCLFLANIYRDTGNFCGSHLEPLKLDLNCQ